VLLRDIKDIRGGRIVVQDALPEIDFQGIPVVIENEEGSIRKGEDHNGDKFTITMFYPYGFIKNTEGTDGDEIDCFVGPNKDAEHVYVIEHLIDGEYDEDKCMLGFSDELHARDAFLAHYDHNQAAHLGKITEMLIEQFKQAIKKHRKGTQITKDESHVLSKQTKEMK
jgi:inorganic pyrophosphatase